MLLVLLLLWLWLWLWLLLLLWFLWLLLLLLLLFGYTVEMANALTLTAQAQQRESVIVYIVDGGVTDLTLLRSLRKDIAKSIQHRGVLLLVLLFQRHNVPHVELFVPLTLLNVCHMYVLANNVAELVIAPGLVTLRGEAVHFQLHLVEEGGVQQQPDIAQLMCE